jgi:hypothetical protein
MLAALAVTASLAGCAGTHARTVADPGTSASPVATSSPALSRPPAAQTTEPSQGTDAACTGAQLRTTSAGGSGASGHLSAILVFTNVSTRGCSLSGFPDVALLTNEHRTLTEATHSNTGYLCLDKCGASPTVFLSPGAQAWAMLEWLNNDPQSGGFYNAALCPDYAAADFLVTPPGTKSSAVLSAAGIPICDRVLVHSVRPESGQ